MNVARAIPETWVLATVGDVCSQPQYGYTTKAADTGDLRLLRTSDITSGRISWETVPYCSDNPADWEKYIVKDGDILVSRAGSVGVSYLVTKPPKAVFASYLIRFKPFIDRQFLAYFLQSPNYWVAIADEKLGIAVPNVNATKLKSITLPIPPAAEQCRIVAKIEELFSELDKGVESLKTALAQLKVYRQALLKHAFEGKLTAQWREENKDKLEKPDQLLARIKQEREARYEQQLQEWTAAVGTWEEGGKRGKRPAMPKPANDPSPIGKEDRDCLLDLPDGWAWVRLAQIFSISPQNGVYKPASEYGSGTQIIRIDDFYGGQLTRRTGFKKLRLSNEEIEKYKVQNSDLIINRVNSIEYLGKCALVDSLTENTVFESNIMKCCVIEDMISKAYVAAYLASHEGRNRLCENAKHAVNQASINQTDVGNTLVPITSMEEQLLIVQKIEQKLSQTDALISQIEGHLKKAEALRQSILKRAFAGQLVAQDPSDEPASILLDRIRTEREQTVKNKTRSHLINV